MSVVSNGVIRTFVGFVLYDVLAYWCFIQNF